MPTVLIVEDDDATRVLVKAVCLRLGLDADCASDGAKGVAMMRTGSYDAMVVDLLMPKVNGFELLREVRAFSKALLAKTIVITAAGSDILRDFDGGGALVLLRKPFDLGDLVDALVACTNCDPPPPGQVFAPAVRR